MKFRFFNVSALDPDAGQEALNAFCGRHRVVTADAQFVAQGAHSFWAVCITYLDGEAPTAASSGRRERIDYKALLSEADFARYAELRTLRKTLSEQDGVPLYALFTNEQLAEMVLRRVTSLSALGAIEGIGKARLEKYGEAFLSLLNAAPEADSAVPRAGEDDEAPADRSV